MIFATPSWLSLIKNLREILEARNFKRFIPPKSSKTLPDAFRAPKILLPIGRHFEVF